MAIKVKPQDGSPIAEAAKQIRSFTETMERLLAESTMEAFRSGSELDTLEEDKPQLASRLGEAEADRDKFRSQVAELGQAEEKRKIDEKAEAEKISAAIDNTRNEVGRIHEAEMEKIKARTDKYIDLRDRSNAKIRGLSDRCKWLNDKLSGRDETIDKLETEIITHKRKLEETDSSSGTIARSAKILKVAEELATFSPRIGWKKMADKLDVLQKAIKARDSSLLA
ncbi:hypothetical protein LTR85_000108 [Meristemomyces frigidus]|nr:hypothetical protein LTR85_000108 [Meristemomyces frigidus]